MDALSPIAMLQPLEPKAPVAASVSASSELQEGLSTKEKKAFQDFEKMFVLMMLKEMRKTQNESSMVEKSHASRMYEEMMDEAMSEQMAASNQLGIARDMGNQLHADRLQQKIQFVESSFMRSGLEAIKV